LLVSSSFVTAKRSIAISISWVLYRSNFIPAVMS
jgi:hypothetical protein